ncbi:MAG TPA: valine--tRNA ligase [Actinomycetes bacterium]|nr:valine--tRNA ligase [Actinomycetes bacterium]
MQPKPPTRPTLDGLERRWADRWARSGVYRFDRTRSRVEVFSIDTPPPTVSGSLHLGHAFSYSQTDVIARFQRMRGRAVFYPMGWDDNGLPTERRVQHHFGVRCDPSLPYKPAFEPPEWPSRQPIAVSRPNFVELCSQLTMHDEQEFEALFRQLGLSVDWSLTYATIGEQARRASQRAFLRLLGKGLAYQADAPTLWEVDFHTAVAQAELEDREVEGMSYRVRFTIDLPDGQAAVEVDTTRPELLAACVALVVHPDDGRFKALHGQTVRTPLFGAAVPVLAHRLADPGKGTGIAMLCTFGDPTDLIWWRELGLPMRPVLDRDGTIRAVAWGEQGFECDDPAAAQRAHDQLAGLPVGRARERVAAMLRQAGALAAPPAPITQMVKFYEHGSQPVEILTSRQWFVRTVGLKAALLVRGSELSWHPEWMLARFQNWVDGLSSDWCISRQRFFGVPFPLWYPLADDGGVDHDHPLVPDETRLPVDPSTDVPAGYGPADRGRPGGFVGAPDVMDTWATSALTPEIAGRWEDDPDLFARVFPMDLRPQGHDIIRTWLFYSVARAHVEHDTLPWAHAVISGWVVDPNRRKLAKSRGDALTPRDALERFGADAVRYWAAGRRAGVDTTFDEGQLRVGRRLATKLLHASRFVLTLNGPVGTGATETLDRAMLAGLAGVVDEATAAFEAYEPARALEATEACFWTFCDHYLELVKGRAYGEAGRAGQASAIGALHLALETMVRLFAPVLPFVTEEVWSWWRSGSVHRSPWPEGGPLRAATGVERPSPLALEAASAVLAEIRRAKTLVKLSLRAPVGRVAVADRPERLAVLAEVADDLCRAGHIADLVLTGPADTVSVEVELAG